jgi:hypothetical protein
MKYPVSHNIPVRNIQSVNAPPGAGRGYIEGGKIEIEIETELVSTVLVFLTELVYTVLMFSYWTHFYCTGISD